MTSTTNTASGEPRLGGRIRLLALLVAVLAIAPAVAATGVYRWQDDQGNVHYGDRPPSKAEPSSIEIEKAPEPAAEDSRRRAKTQRLLEAMESERERERTQEAQATADKERREQNCQVARRRVDFFERANSLFHRGPDGERIYLSDAERSRVLSQARSQVSEWCK